MSRIRAFSLVVSLVVGVGPLTAQTASQQLTRETLLRQPKSILPAPDSGKLLAPAVVSVSNPDRLHPTELQQHRARQEVVMRSRSVDYSGPRFGVTWLPRAAVDSLKAHNIKVGQTITQYGWQMEHEIHVSPDGPRILNEWVLLAGGLESGVFLPSFTWLVGARDKAGNEIGVGPNGSVAGVGLAAAAGVTMHSGGINFPINFAVAKSKTGARYSVLTGFTIH